MLSACVEIHGGDDHNGCGEEVHGAHGGLPDAVEGVEGASGGFDCGDEDAKREGGAGDEHEQGSQGGLLEAGGQKGAGQKGSML